jgi:hypothetical protein
MYATYSTLQQTVWNWKHSSMDLASSHPIVRSVPVGTAQRQNAWGKADNLHCSCKDQIFVLILCIIFHCY